jgi:hypothetical protein
MSSPALGMLDLLTPGLRSLDGVDTFMHHPLLRTLASLSLSLALTLPMSAAFAADFPIGTYTAGAKTSVTFDGKGQFRVYEGKDLKVSGQYTVKADRFELTDKEGSWACTKSAEQTGSYTWKYENSLLTFTKIADLCSDRVGSLVKTSWKWSHAD